MSMLGFSVPHETARILSEIDVPGIPEDVAHSHVTLVMMGDDLPIEQLSRVTEAIYPIASTIRPFTLTTRRVSCFSGGKHGVPVICLVESEQLHELHAKVCETLDAAGIEYSKKYPEYRPHVTLSYSDEPIEDLDIPPISWGAHELIIYGGDTADQRIVTHLPFSLRNRVASRYKGKASLPVERVVRKFKTLQW